MNNPIPNIGLPSGGKFGAGVLGKTSHVALACVTAWGVILWRISDNITLDVALVSGGIIMTIFAAWYVRSSQRFAEDNPAQALLEGSSLVDLRRAEMEAKGGALLLSKPAEMQSLTVVDSKVDDQ